MTIAYADGSRKPAWSEFDFCMTDLNIVAHGCNCEFARNRMVLSDWSGNSTVEVRGFDRNRELDLSIGVTKSAPQN